MLRQSRWIAVILSLFITLPSLKAQNNDVALPVDLKSSKHGKIVEVEPGMVELTTQGRSLILQLASFRETPPKEKVVLSFDYFCATGLEFMVVLANNNTARIEENMIRLPIAEGWSTYSVDVSDKLAVCGRPGGTLSLLIAPNAAKNTVMRIRNIRLRAYTEKELTQKAAEETRIVRERRMEKDLNAYLYGVSRMEINRVAVTEKEILIEGDTKGIPGEIYLCEVPMFGDLTEQDFLIQIPIQETGKFTRRVERSTQVDDLEYDRLYSRWVLVQKKECGYTFCSKGHYPDEVQSKYSYPKEVVRNKKGIGGYRKNAFESDLDDLQISSITLNIWLNSFVRLSPGKNTIPFTYNGKTYYAEKKEIDALDETLLSTSKRGIIVSAIILVAPERSSQDKAAGKLMEHPDFNQAGIYTMPNMTTLESLNIYAAAIDFLASRYGRADQKYGRIHHWIAHNEVDAGWVWTNAGIKTPLRFMDIYVKSMRLLYYTARKYNPNSEVFITLTHYWQSRHNEYCYPSAQLLDLLLDYTVAEGDFQWGVAHHPYPESLFEPKTWLDKAAEFNYNTPQITFKNLEVLDAWIKQPRTLYKGKEKRTLFLSEQNPNSKDYSEQALAEQAACMAYVCKKLEALDGIDAYQMHGWFDQRGEGGLRIGVRRFRDDETDPGGRKPAWYVFRDAGTEREAETFEFAKKIIGIDSWDEIMFKGEIGTDNHYPARDLQADTWVGMDALGRSLPTFGECGPRKENRYVGMFYFLTHNNNGAAEGPYDVSKILKKDPETPQWGNGTHYWGEPETGYYIMKDEWMIRRHARMLSDAGVDVIVFDVTNDRIYKDVIFFIGDVFRKMRSEGERTPAFACLGSQKSIEQLWKEIYSRGKYADLWFYWKGKPLLMFGQHVINGRKEMNDVRFPKEITDFFTIRQSWAWTTLNWYDNGQHEWPWIDHTPQSVGWDQNPAQAEYVPVAVAQHPLSNIGRSFHQGEEPDRDQYGVTPDTDKGLYFEEQWKRALEVDPEFVFVTGWNEWTAGKMTRTNPDYKEEMARWDFFPGAVLGKNGREVKMGESYFIDQYNQEFSRDIEPMKGGHGDNYYYQLMANVRRYKGVAEPVCAGVPMSIDLQGDFAQWEKVGSRYFDHQGDTFTRNSPGNFAAGPYVDNTGRNDIVESRVARDEKYVYFWVQTADKLTPHTDPKWMLLFIDTDQNAQTGWNGYDLLINDGFSGDKSLVKRYKSGDWTRLGTAEFRYEGNQLMIRISRKYFGESPLRFDFHWSDNIQSLDSIEEFLLHGDQAPSRRANYRYNAE